MMDRHDLFFDVTTPLGFRVYTTKTYWEYIISIKHQYIKGMKSYVIATLENPDFIRQSKGFIITIYITDRIKEGVQIWEKSE